MKATLLALCAAFLIPAAASAQDDSAVPRIVSGSPLGLLLPLAQSISSPERTNPLMLHAQVVAMPGEAGSAAGAMVGNARAWIVAARELSGAGRSPNFYFTSLGAGVRVHGSSWYPRSEQPLYWSVDAETHLINVGDDRHLAFGVRMPWLLSRTHGALRVSVFAAPAVAWGFGDPTSCEEPGGCYGNDVSAATGFELLLAAGASLRHRAFGFGAQLGLQQVVTESQNPVLALGLTYTH